MTDQRPDPPRDDTRRQLRSEPTDGPRAPRLIPFLVTGAALGLLAGMVLALLGPASPVASDGQELVLLGLTGGLLGGLAGAVVFLVVEWTTLR